MKTASIAALLGALLLPLAATAYAQAPTLDSGALERWPRAGTIIYRVDYGSGGVPIGEARHQWTHDSRSYSMSLELRTTGAAALLHKLQYTQRSAGEIGDHGLRPLQFTVDQAGRPSIAVDFDWKTAIATIPRAKRSPRTATIAAGDQDMLSLWHQVHLFAARALPADLTVITKNRAKAARIEAAGEEKLQLPVGEIDATRMRVRAAADSLDIELWLDKHRGLLPVRIRIVDDDGGVLDQRATAVDIAPATAAGKAAGKGMGKQ